LIGLLDHQARALDALVGNDLLRIGERQRLLIFLAKIDDADRLAGSGRARHGRGRFGILRVGRFGSGSLLGRGGFLARGRRRGPFLRRGSWSFSGRSWSLGGRRGLRAGDRISKQQRNCEDGGNRYSETRKSAP
jgi:hypothetical protein